MSRIRNIRNDELTTAAIRAVHRHGFALVTMNDIALEANASAASINYYFGTKERLMEATMRRLLGLLKQASIERLSQAQTPLQRLHALVAANFDDRLFTPAQCSLWVQFWSNAPYAPRLARLHRINRSRVQSHLHAEVKQLAPPDQADTITATLQAYMDGIWLEAAQSETCTPATARKDAITLVTRLLT